MPYPSIGRVVNYAERGQCFAALITCVRSKTSVDLAVFGYPSRLTTGMTRHGAGTEIADVEYDASEPALGRTWHWPERV